MKSVIENFAYLLKLLWRIELNVKFAQCDYELVKCNLLLCMRPNHLLDDSFELLLVLIDWFSGGWT